MSFGLSAEVILKLRSVFEKYSEISEVILYGSRAKGNFKPESDIDLTLKGNHLNLKTLLKIENEIDDLLLPYKVDLSLYDHIDNSDLMDHIRRVGVRLF